LANNIKPFTVEELDAEIMDIIMQQTGGPEKKGPPNIVQQALDRVKKIKGGANASSNQINNQT